MNWFENVHKTILKCFTEKGVKGYIYIYIKLWTLVNLWDGGGIGKKMELGNFLNCLYIAWLVKMRIYYFCHFKSKLKQKRKLKKKNLPHGFKKESCFVKWNTFNSLINFNSLTIFKLYKSLLIEHYFLNSLSNPFRQLYMCQTTW